MKPKITFNIEDDILTCFVTGKRHGDAVLEIWESLVNKCHHEDVKLVQVTMALRGKYEPFAAIEIYQAVIEMLKPTGIKVALVDLNHLSVRDSQVACNMAVGKGIHASFFDQPADARTWLLKHRDKVSKAAFSKKNFA